MRTLVIVVHPELAGKSRIHRRLTEELKRQGEVTVHDLYAAYPDERIDIAREQELVMAHDRLVLQFPFWWYSAPHLMKKWMDEVLTFGWAYGPDGDKLHGKELGLAISTGSAAEAYGPDGYNGYSMAEMTRPYEVGSNLIGMRFMPLFVIHGAMTIGDEELDRLAATYAQYVIEPTANAVRQEEPLEVLQNN
jgi:glutathione-regulated potassium-efflux system ancillary protein KefG